MEIQFEENIEKLNSIFTHGNIVIYDPTLQEGGEKGDPYLVVIIEEGDNRNFKGISIEDGFISETFLKSCFRKFKGTIKVN